ncbi:MAG TPA: porin [Candidatus Aquilonibacter sp.]|nr:porin [Candidatus Aquilonibacter sp.]
MSYLSTKRASRFATGIFAAVLALSLAPAGQAQSAVQAGGDSSASTSAAPAKNTQQQLDDLQKEMAAIEQQISALKAQQEAAPSVQAASYVQTPAAAPAEAAKISLASLLGPVTISGVVDAYYGYDYNHPADNTDFLTPFTANTNAFGLNMVELIVDKPPDATSADSRFGYHVAAGYGNAAAIVNGSDVANFYGLPGEYSDEAAANFYLKEAYGQYLAPIGKGLTIQVGKFVTPVGNEVIESSGNWNYSRSLLFYYAIPYFHVGVNAKYAWNSKIAATFYLVNGWNNSAIFHNTTFGSFGLNSAGLTYGTSIAYTPNAKWAVTENYFAGPVIDEIASDAGGTTINDWKQLSDTVIGYTPNAKWAFALNGDYGFGPKTYGFEETGGVTVHPAALPTGYVQTAPSVNWWGVAGYAKYTINPKSYFAARYEYFGDPDGYAFEDEDDPTLHLHAQEFTGTYSYNITSGLQVRGEYRYDFLSQPDFEVGSGDRTVKEQNTATLGFIYSFSSANAK